MKADEVVERTEKGSGLIPHRITSTIHVPFSMSPVGLAMAILVVYQSAEVRHQPIDVFEEFAEVRGKSFDWIIRGAYI